MKKFMHTFFYAILITFISGLTANAQNYSLKKGVFASGGGETSSTNYYLYGTIGQTIIGINNSDLQIVKAGFWHEKSGPTTNLQSLKEGLNTNDFFKAYPNPFHSEINLKLNLNKQTKISVKVYNSSGKLIQTIVDDELMPQHYHFVFHSKGLPNGIYYCRLVSNTQTVTEKLSLIR